MFPYWCPICSKKYGLVIIFSSCFLVFFQVFSNFPVMISLFHHIPMIFLSFFPLVHDFPIKFPTFPHDFPGVSPIPSPSVAPLRHRGEACRARTSWICWTRVPLWRPGRTRRRSMRTTSPTRWTRRDGEDVNGRSSGSNRWRYVSTI